MDGSTALTTRTEARKYHRLNRLTFYFCNTIIEIRFN